MSGKDLAVIRTAKTGIANLDGVLEVFRELTEKGILSCAELVKESDPRSGFFERADFERVRKHLAARPDLQLAISLANAFG